jgi:phage host-nuclease inhibitor protein Gam
MSGNDDETIGPAAFVDVCKKHGLVQLVDIHAYREGELRALSHHLHIIDDDETFKISTGTQTDPTLPVIDKNRSAKSALSKSVKAVTALRMTSKMNKFMSAKNNTENEAFKDNTNASTGISTFQHSKTYNNTEHGSFNDDDDGSVNTNASSINSETNTNTSDSSLQRVMASFQSSKALLQSNITRNDTQQPDTNRSKLDIFLPANIAAANHREDINNANSSITNNNSNMDNNINSFQNSIPMRNPNNKVNFAGLITKVRNDDINTNTNSMVIRHPISNTATNNDITNRSNHYVTTNSNIIPMKSEVSHLKLPVNENISKILSDDITNKLKLRKLMRRQDEGFNDDDSY